jgi:hypothetical protein
MMLIRYEPGIDSDLTLLAWWQHMALCDDLERGFSVELASVGAFLSVMRECDLVYCADDDGIWFASWCEPKLTGAFWGVWVRADRSIRR